MFGQKMQVKIGSAHPRVLVENDTPRRVTSVSLYTDADDDLAAGMGDAAIDALKHLRSGASERSVVLLDAIQVRAEFSAGEKDKLAVDCACERALLTKPKKEESGPLCCLRIALATKETPVWWLIEHLDTTVELRLKKKQMDLPATEKRS